MRRVGAAPHGSPEGCRREGSHARIPHTLARARAPRGTNELPPPPGPWRLSVPHWPSFRTHIWLPPRPPGPVGPATSHQRLKERPCRRSPRKQRSGGATAADCSAVMRPTTRVSGSRLHCLVLTAKRRCRSCTCSPLPRIFCAFRKVRSLRQGQTCRVRVLQAAVTGLHNKRDWFVRPDARLAAAADGKPTCVPQADVEKLRSRRVAGQCASVSPCNASTHVSP